MDITTESRIQKVEEEPLPVERPDLEHSHTQEPGSRPEGEHEMQAVDGSARQLNVTDALSYLDAVKTQFVERPDVYNNFLDIMKDFKSQYIDTPGVIARVSALFHGHSDLIQGFNTFLPPGYRIECTSSTEATTITVTTPAGTTTQSTDNQYSTVIPYIHNGPQQEHPPLIIGPTPVYPHTDSPLPHPGSPIQYGAAESILANGMLNNDSQERGRQGPAAAQEFNLAIQYVNKIKTRYEEDPETYKHFLEILHHYRKDQNHEDVYLQVAALFKDAPDLLAEFKNFLPPDGAGSMEPINDAAWGDNGDRKAPREGPSAIKRKKRLAERENQPPPPVAPAKDKASTSRSKKTKHAHVKDNAIPPSPNYPYSRPQSPAQQSYSNSHVPATQTGGAGPSGASGSNAQDELAFFDRAKNALKSRETYDEFLKLLNLFSREIIDARTLVTRAETYLGDGELYHQFKDLMGWDVQRDGENKGPPGSIRDWTAQQTETEERYGKSYRRLPISETRLACSGRDELCRSVLNDVWVSHPTWASEESGFVAHKKNTYEEALHKSEEERHEFQFYIDIITRTIALLQPINDRIGEMTPDERNAFRLPPDFGGSSKSIYHRAIKKVYGRDAQGLEALQAVQECPAVAVPILLPRLKQKNEEWRRAQREWNRIWREVDARNFYKSLDHQGISFKQNDKKYITSKSLVAEIENAKTAVEGATAKAKLKYSKHKRDPKNTTTIEDIYDLEHAPHLDLGFEDISVLQDALKLVFSFLDRSTIQYSSLERRSVEHVDTTDNEEGGQEDTNMSDDGDDSHHGSGTGSKKSGATSGRRSAGGSNHGHGGVHPSDLRKKLLKTVQEKAVKARSGSASASRAVSPTGSDEEHRDREVGNRKQDGRASGSPTPKRKKSGRAKEVPIAHTVESEEWVKLMPFELETGKIEQKDDDHMDIDSQDLMKKLADHGIVNDRPFFTNTTFYSLLRLLHLLYSRLLQCKETAKRLLSISRQQSIFTVNPVAEELGLVDAHGPGAVLALATNVPTHPPQEDSLKSHQHHGINGINGVVPGASPEIKQPPNGNTINDVDASDRPEAHFYGYMLDACEKLFEGELEQVVFEENMRFLFGTKAYTLFTLDKLIGALIKQVQTAVLDNKCQELVTLLSRARAKETTTVRELIGYRREAEQYLGQDDHLYRVEWDVERKRMKLWLLGAADSSLDLGAARGRAPGARAAGRWRVYAESYVRGQPTELVIQGRVRRPFLLRTKCDEEEEGGESRRWVTEGRVEVEIRPGCRLVYRNGMSEIGYSAS